MSWCVYSLGRCLSTQRVAWSWVVSGRAWDGLVFRASYQEGGYGQRGRVWHAASGKNVLCSLVLRSSGEADFLVRVLWAMSLAVRGTLAHWLGDAGGEVVIKWPNDVLIRRKGGTWGKVAGILTESRVRGSKVGYVVVGIGVNVNQHMGLVDGAASLVDLIGKGVSLDEVFAVLEAEWARYFHWDMGRLRSAYTGHLYGLGERVGFELLRTGAVFEAVVVGVDDRGMLRLVDGLDGGELGVFAPTTLSWRGLFVAE